MLTNFQITSAKPADKIKCTGSLSALLDACKLPFAALSNKNGGLVVNSHRMDFIVLAVPVVVTGVMFVI